MRVMRTEVEPGRRDLAVAGTAIRYGEQALELEAEAGRHPDWAGELLLDAATAWRQAGEQERAIAVLRELVASGGEDGQFAQVLLAEAYFELGRDDDARAELAALKSAPPCSPGPCEAAAELLEERGDLVVAGEWYEAAAAALTEDDLAALDGEFGWPSYPAHVLLGRSRVRRLLGVPPDELDHAVRRARERSGTGAFPSTDSVRARCEPCSGNGRSSTPVASAGRPCSTATGRTRLPITAAWKTGSASCPGAGSPASRSSPGPPRDLTGLPYASAGTPRRTPPATPTCASWWTQARRLPGRHRVMRGVGAAPGPSTRSAVAAPAANPCPSFSSHTQKRQRPRRREMGR